RRAEYSEREIDAVQQPIHDTERLGALIRAERKAQGLRQPDLAAAAGTSVRFVVEVERGKPTAQIGKVLELLRQLGLRLAVDGLSDTEPADGT
ncbi:MAG: helix-turn-helix transcriptional regulator, partial [Planctomycetota bacterium]